MSFNKITVVGNLGKDPELNYTGQGKAVCKLSVATSEKRRDAAGELQTVTTWFRITLWGTQAETASRFLQKGSPVYIEGRLRVEEWTDRDGKQRYTLEVQGMDMQFIGSSSNASTDSQDIRTSSLAPKTLGAAAGNSPKLANVKNTQRQNIADEEIETESFGPNQPFDDDIPF